MGFLSLNCPFFQFSAYFDFLVDLRVIFELIFFVSKRFRCCSSEIQISLLFRQRLKLRSGFIFSHSLSLDSFVLFLTFLLIGDYWNPVMEH